MTDGRPEGVRLSRGLAIHGGVGTLDPADMTPELASAYRDVLAESLLAGHAVLEDHGSAVDATVAAVRVMEDSPLFNAGRGSNYDERGVIAMDASIMSGPDGAAGAVAGVTDVRYPVELARLVMERSEHVFLIGDGAEAFARAQGVPVTEQSFFHTDRRWNELQTAKQAAGGRPNVIDPTSRAGTVGAVAIDGDGRLAAATSTGGMVNKRPGRAGDSPIIGAGTWADEWCAVSATGHGEPFICRGVAARISALMELGGQSLEEAAHRVVHEELPALEGAGGIIAVGGDGTVSLCFNTAGMFRAAQRAGGGVSVAIWGEEPRVEG